jgi:hypothetical protein
MSYKIVKDLQGNLVAFGPNDENYMPNIKENEILVVESGKIAEDMISQYQAQQLSIASESANKKAALLERLGITAEEAKILLS